MKVSVCWSFLWIIIDSLQTFWKKKYAQLNCMVKTFSWLRGFSRKLLLINDRKSSIPKWVVELSFRKLTFFALKEYQTLINNFCLLTTAPRNKQKVPQQNIGDVTPVCVRWNTNLSQKFFMQLIFMFWY